DVFTHQRTTTRTLYSGSEKYGTIDTSNCVATLSPRYFTKTRNTIQCKHWICNINRIRAILFRTWCRSTQREFWTDVKRSTELYAQLPIFNFTVRHLARNYSTWAEFDG